MLHDHYNEHGINFFGVVCVKSEIISVRCLGVIAIEVVSRLEFQKYHISIHCGANILLIFVINETIRRKKERNERKPRLDINLLVSSWK